MAASVVMKQSMVACSGTRGGPRAGGAHAGLDHARAFADAADAHRLAAQLEFTAICLARVSLVMMASAAWSACVGEWHPSSVAASMMPARTLSIGMRDADAAGGADERGARGQASAPAR